MLGSGSSSSGDSVNPVIFDVELKISSEFGEFKSPHVQMGLSAENSVSIIFPFIFPGRSGSSSRFYSFPSIFKLCAVAVI